MNPYENDMQSLRERIKQLEQENQTLKTSLQEKKTPEDKKKTPHDPKSFVEAEKPSGPSPKREISSQVISTNPYSRLMALERMKVVSDFRKIREYSVGIIGIGGIGTVTAEMLTRCGIGKLVLFDYDTVEEANLNRLFFMPNHVGRKKVQVAKEVLTFINPDVEISAYDLDVTKVDNISRIQQIFTQEGIPTKHPQNPNTILEKKIDLILICVDNFQARIAINNYCLELDIPFFESGVSENAISGHIQFFRPGMTSCFDCAPPLVVTHGNEKEMKREGVCAASLPTVMGIVAGFLVQNTLKLLLEFGEVSTYLGMNSLYDFFPKEVLNANPDCRNALCRQRQKEFQEKAVDQKLHHLKGEPATEKKDEPLHTENEFEIELVGSSFDPIQQEEEKFGTKFLFEKEDQKEDEKGEEKSEDFFNQIEQVDLQNLMNKLKE